MNVRRFLSCVVLVGLVGLVAVPALATDESTDSTGGGEVAPSEDVVEGPAPAITAPVEAADEAELDWTYRYLIPTLVALAAVVVIFTTVQYFRQVVQNRYKVVKE